MRILGAVVALAALAGTAAADPYRNESGNRDRYSYERGEDRYRGDQVRVPRGHLPPRGQCRVWFDDRPAGQQPPPMSCERAWRIAERTGAFIVTSRGRIIAPYG